MATASAFPALRRTLGWSIALSLFMILAGILAIALPQVAGVAVNIVVGWLLIFSAAFHFVFAWHTRGAGAIVWEILVGVVYALIGGYLLSHPVLGLIALTLGLAFYLAAEGLLEFILFFQLRPAPGAGWLLFDGIVTWVLAVLIWRTWPSSAEWILGTYVGISMLFSGVSRLMFLLAARRLATT